MNASAAEKLDPSSESHILTCTQHRLQSGLRVAPAPAGPAGSQVELAQLRPFFGRPSGCWVLVTKDAVILSKGTEEAEFLLELRSRI